MAQKPEGVARANDNRREVTKSKSAAGEPVPLVKGLNSDLRLCMDYKGLNTMVTITLNNRHNSTQAGD